MNFNQFKFVGGKVDLNALPTEFDGGERDSDLKKESSKIWKDIADLQEKLYAQSQQSLLIVLQAMDAAGKDSTIGKLTKSMNAQGCHIHSFKKPTEQELAHDFMWRVHSKAPAKGEIAIFNRSHYEDVLIVKVHGWASQETIEKRYAHINHFESLIADSNTKVVKFMLNISPDYQLSRFKRRLDNPGKHWKFNPSDLDERKLWSDYMRAFESAIEHCATEQSPWFVVPAENRDFRDFMIASIVRDTLNDMQPDYPAPTFDADVYTSGSIT